MKGSWWTRHLRERQLLLLSLAATGHDEAPALSRAETEHLAACARCAARLAALEAFLARLRDEAVAAADEAFSPERLLAQRLRILRRIERLSTHPGPARVLPFPAIVGAAARVAGHGRRWIAAAAAAGMLVGVVAGRFVALKERAAPHGSPGASGFEGSLPAAQERPFQHAALDEERLLVEIEDALGAPRVEELRAIDAVTPRIQDVTFTLR